jgi:hypothetical protein
VAAAKPTNEQKPERSVSDTSIREHRDDSSVLHSQEAADNLVGFFRSLARLASESAATEDK